MSTENDQKEVFISYSTKNTELAQFLCNQLEGSGATCWIAPRDIPSGGKWDNEIVVGLENAKVFLLLVSEASVASEEVAKEITLANSMKKIMIPVRIENATLRGGALYHFSNKQWVDALEADKFTRFNATVDVILKKMDKESSKSDVVSGSVADMARNLANSLNRKHRERLDKINAMFTCWERGKNEFLFTFPITIGASGVDLIFIYDGNKKEMEIYADAANDGDPIKYPFVDVIKKYCGDLFHNLEKIKGTRKGHFAELVPKIQLMTPTPLVSPSPEKGFKIFEENMIAFSEKVLPKLFDWVDYACNVIDAINRLEERLKEVFPKAEGWCVGAPEGSRLNGCRQYGFISVYKKSWQPKDDNYNNRGLLSITLESGDHFINDLYIGILKYEPWMTLKDWEGQIVSECGKPVEKWDDWVWWQRLDEEWGCSGIAQGDFPWDGKFDDFINHCIDKFTKLKTLALLLDKACDEMEAMQELDTDSKENIEVAQTESWTSSLYIYNVMMKLAKVTRQTIKDKFGTDDIIVDFSYKGEWWTGIYLKFKVQKFDAAVLFKCSKNQMTTAVTNLEPPDFETRIISDFFSIKGVEFTEKKADENKEYNGGTFLSWLDEFQRYVEEQIAVVVPVIIDLKKHLENVVELTRQIELELVAKLPTEDEWVVKNEAFSLEKYDSIAIWNKKWLRDGAEHPPLVVQINPDQPCFDDLTLAVKLLDRPLPEIERNLGEICGACDFAFGRRPDTNTEELWKKPLDDKYKRTGGSQFDIKLIDGEQRDALISHIGEVAGKVKQMEIIIAEACRVQNEAKQKNELLQLIDDIIKTLSGVFPKEEGWEYFQNAKDLQRDCGIYFFKTIWKREGLERGVISYAIECENAQFDSLCYGIAKGSNHCSIDPAKEQLLVSKITELFGGGENTLWWPYYKYFDNPHRYINDILNNKEGFLTLIRDIFSKMKNDVTRLVDDIVTTKSITKNE